ncbi:hypothetical protein [uncultured Microbacterium sp.]|uniref:hypothetical protein n=1 Tax=uncultured Microbacterium sp. TaxID=191216 RepID=UPI0025D307A6|nr:hypothetical protein [uncultured Microbacterium sp.]
MGFNISGFDDVQKNIHKAMSDQVHEALAEQLAEKARELGLDSADTINLEIETDSDHDGIQIDAQRVRDRASQILAGG